MPRREASSTLTEAIIAQTIWLEDNDFTHVPDMHEWTRDDGQYVTEEYLSKLPADAPIVPRRKAMRKSPHAHR